MKNSTEVPSMAVTIKKPFASYLKTNKQQHRKSQQQITLSYWSLLLSPLSTRVEGSFLWLPPTTQQHSRQQTLVPPPLLEYILLLSRLPAGVEKEPICEGANTRSPIIAQRRQKIATQSVNYFFLLGRKKRITLGFKDALLEDDSMAVNIPVLQIRTLAPPYSPRALAIDITECRI